jgi:hypothetical protein
VRLSKKLVQRRTCEFLLYASATIIIPAAQGNWNGIGLYDNFNEMFIVFLQKIDFGSNAHQVFDFVGNVVHQVFGIFYANDLANIIFAYIDFPSLRVGKAAYPFEVIIVPT